MTIAPRLLQFLNGNNIAYQAVAHPKTNSSKETADAAHIFEDHLAKGVILKDPKGYLMAIIPASEWISLHRLNDELDRELELASEQEVDRLFADCQPGAVPIIGEAYGIEAVIDQDLLSLSRIFFEAGDHELLIQVDGEQFRKLAKGLRRGFFCERE